MASRRITNGSILVGVGFLTLGVTFSVRVMFALAMPFIRADTGWDPLFLSTVMSIALIVSGFLTPVAGRMADRNGPRGALLIGLATIGVGMTLVSLAWHPAVMVFGFGLVGGAGFALVSTSVVSTAVALAFTTNRGFATGIATSGESAGQFLFIPLFAILLAATSWRLSFGAGALACFLLVGVVAVAMRPSRNISSSPTGQATDKPRTSLIADVRYLSAQPVFYLLFVSYFICGVTSTGIIESQFMPFAAFCGIPPLPTATAYGLLSLLNLGGMVLAGWLADRIDRVALLAGIYFIRALTFLLLIGVGTNYQTLLVFAVIFGIVDYSTVPVTVSLCASHLDRRILGFAFGLISGGHSVGAALGAILGGAIFSSTAGYGLMWLTGTWAALGAAVLVLGIYRTRPAARLPA